MKAYAGEDLNDVWLPQVFCVKNIFCLQQFAVLKATILKLKKRPVKFQKMPVDYKIGGIDYFIQINMSKR